MDGIICVNKPAGFTSFDVVAKCRGILRERRIGHGGTLDPMATGVLPLFLGRATPAADLAGDAIKAYTAGVKLGMRTDTYDVTGRVLSTAECHVSKQQLDGALSGFVGEIEQIPPMYSAVKINGQRLYDIARSGGEVDRPARKVTVHSIESESDGEDYLLRIVCSKGTYVRSIVNDLGELLGCGAVLTSLVRTRSCGFDIDDCVTLQQLQICRDEGCPERYLRPVGEVFKDLPRLCVEGENLRRFLNGAPTHLSGLADGRYCTWTGEDFLGLAEIEDGVFYTKKLFVDQAQANKLYFNR